MKFENFSPERLEPPSKLQLQALDMPGRTMIITELDRPLVLTQETRKELPVMSTETRERLEEKGFPDAILEVIGSDAEAQIYDDANLEPAQVNGKDALIRTDIDYDQKDEFGKTNLERMKLGKPPLDADGNPIELHHIGQKSDAPLAELTRGEHRGNGNDNVLHDKLKESEINREDFGKERKDYWKARAEAIENQRGAEN